MLVEVKNVCTRVVCHRRLSRLSAPQPSLGGCGRCWPAVCWGLDSLRAQLPLLQLHSLCHPGACVVAATFGPQAPLRPSQPLLRQTARLELVSEPMAEPKRAAGWPWLGLQGQGETSGFKILRSWFFLIEFRQWMERFIFSLPARFWVMAQSPSCFFFLFLSFFPKYFFLSHKITFITDFYLGLMNIFIKLKVTEKLYFLFFFWRMVVGLCHMAYRVSVLWPGNS